MFYGGIKRDQWYEKGLSNVFILKFEKVLFLLATIRIL